MKLVDEDNILNVERQPVSSCRITRPCLNFSHPVAHACLFYSPRPATFYFRSKLGTIHLGASKTILEYSATQLIWSRIFSLDQALPVHFSSTPRELVSKRRPRLPFRWFRLRTSPSETKTQEVSLLGVTDHTARFRALLSVLKEPPTSRE